MMRCSVGLFAFSLGAGGAPQEQQEQHQGPLREHAADAGTGDSAVLAFLADFRREVVGRLDALDAAVRTQGERLGHLEARVQALGV